MAVKETWQNKEAKVSVRVYFPNLDFFDYPRTSMQECIDKGGEFIQLK